ncbi:HAD-IIIC family phosphatase [Photobacterium kishitanii]|uniref:HAD-IIIC family phosphatase n=1 Tax=Photobacterium kishitanii TaxID=318456 RepID=UPI000D159F84|nr:HAD-IIIC family phosphatase [Photobacterium kishitanii]PSW50279.1 FkbH like protein [Photobacterium kishitanii]
MYQLEVLSQQDLQQALCLPKEVQQAFILGQTVIDNCFRYSVLQWEEHCTECAMPACYKTCDLYEPRRDGHCRRFVKGIVPLSIAERQYPVVQVDFKRWGALMSTSYIGVFEPQQADIINRKASRAEYIAQHAEFSDGLSIAGRRGIVVRMATRYKNYLSQSMMPKQCADAFLIEIYCETKIDLSIVIRAIKGKLNKIPFQYRLQKAAGYHQVFIPFKSIAPHVDFQEMHFINIIPNRSEAEEVNPLTVVFGFVGFIQQSPQLQERISLDALPNKSIKVLVWDLDNTLWDGVLVEDGADRIQLKKGITEVIKTLDARGIVSSIASKNDHDIAWAHLSALGLAAYFVFPEINWGPKSQSIQRIAENFNVGKDTIAFIDDSAFERNEVKNIHPEVSIFKHSDYMTLTELAAFSPQTSSESALRRSFYVAQQKRSTVRCGFDGEYGEFIKTCNIQLQIRCAQLTFIDRIHELVQRTNQMNFSATRYDREMLIQLIQDQSVATFFLNATDKFGDYGTVGFCIIDLNQRRVTDLMFSCRIQSKRVEHAFLGWLLNTAYLSGWDCLQVEYKATAKNSQSEKVFSDLEFKKITQHQGVAVYSKETTSEDVSDCFITIDAPNIVFTDR